jgi:hypothetical protein
MGDPRRPTCLQTPMEWFHSDDTGHTMVTPCLHTPQGMVTYSTGGKRGETCLICLAAAFAVRTTSNVLITADLAHI